MLGAYTTILLTWYVSKGLKFWKIISEGKGWKMASSMSTFEIFWCVVSDMSISSIIVGRRMCRVSAKRWKFIFGEMEHMKTNEKYQFRPENADFDPKYGFRPEIPIQKYRFLTQKCLPDITDFDSKISILTQNID